MYGIIKGAYKLDHMNFALDVHQTIENTQTMFDNESRIYTWPYHFFVTSNIPKQCCILLSENREVYSTIVLIIESEKSITLVASFMAFVITSYLFLYCWISSSFFFVQLDLSFLFELLSFLFQ